MDFGLVTTEDKKFIYSYIYDIVDEYMKENIMMMKKPNFHEDMHHTIMDGLRVTYENIYDYALEEDLYVISQKVYRDFFSRVMPRRSYKTSFAKPRVHHDNIKNSIEKLRNVPQHEQRTPEWYEDRWNMISASSAWKALSSESMRNSLIYEKCVPIDTSKYANVNINSPFHWGQKYEPLSILIYEDKYNTVVEDFGCIPHPEYSNIGASPDGINTDPKSSRYGRMVEVKNRFSNSVPITGIPKEEYWIQMQLQMNVCDLNECDFLETRFKEYSSSSEFYADAYSGSGSGHDSFTKTASGNMKGIYLYFEKDGMPYYEYPKLNISKSDFEIWEENMIATKEKEGYTWISYIYWYLDKMSCVLVFRNKVWFEKALLELNKTWQIVLKERIEGYEHRAPKKRVRKITENTHTGCLIDIGSLNVDT